MTKRTSEATKKLRGTARADRRLTVPDASERILIAPRAPGHLTPAAAGEWVRLAAVLVELGTLTGADLRALELLAQTLASATLFAAAVEKDGPLIESAGSRKAHPALQALATARSQARALLRDFGLVPSARGGVEAAPHPKDDADDPYAEFG